MYFKRPVLLVSLASFSAVSAEAFLVVPAVELNHAVRLAESHIDMFINLVRLYWNKSASHANRVIRRTNTHYIAAQGIHQVLLGFDPGESTNRKLLKKL